MPPNRTNYLSKTHRRHSLYSPINYLKNRRKKGQLPPIHMREIVDAFEALPDEHQAYLDRQCQLIGMSVDGMGAMGALELLSKLGMFCHTHLPHSDLEYLMGKLCLDRKDE